MRGPDQQLIDRLLAGDTEAEATFLSRYRGLAVGLARGRFGLDPLAANEVWQEVVLKLWAEDHKALRAWRGEGRFSTYLTVIVVRLCVRRGTAALRREDPLASASEVVDEAPGPRQRAVRAERRRVLAAVLEELSARDRLLLNLRYQDGYKPVEIAQLLRLSPGAVRKALHDAQKRVRKRLLASQPGLFQAASTTPFDGAGGNTSVVSRSHSSGGGE